jgi:hypothetical protein
MAIINKTGITNGSTIQASHVTRAIDALSGVGTDTVIASGSFSGSLVGGPVNVSTVAASTINCNGTIIGTSLFIDTGNAYGIAATADSMSFNSQNEDFNTEIKHYGGATSTIFSANGISTNNRIVATSFTGSLQGTASFATQTLSSSFATTASFALNAGGGAGVGFPFTGSATISGSLRINAPALNQYALVVTGSAFTSGSFIGFAGQLDNNTNLTANKNGIINLAGLGGNGFNGKFVLPNNEPEQPVAGAVYWDDAAGRLYVYKESDPPGWTQI